MTSGSEPAAGSDPDAASRTAGGVAGSALGAAWHLLLAAAARRRAGSLPSGPGALRLASDGLLVDVAPDDGRAVLRRLADGTFAPGPALDEEAREFVELYLPLLCASGGGSFVLAHLGQSVDGCIATAGKGVDVVTGPEDFVHMHRLRALADAVIVGAGTVAEDDPRLTTRLVEGPNPVRVVIDPRSRLDDGFGVFGDGAAPTLRVRSAEHAPGRSTVETLVVPADGEGLSLGALLDALRARGLRVLFVEGGGVTVTRWLAAGRLDRLHLVAAPLLLGTACPALTLPAARSAADGRRPPCRLYRLGRDVLWDFDLRGEAAPDLPPDDAPFRRLL